MKKITSNQVLSVICCIGLILCLFLPFMMYTYSSSSLSGTIQESSFPISAFNLITGSFSIAGQSNTLPLSWQYLFILAFLLPVAATLLVNILSDDQKRGTAGVAVSGSGLLLCVIAKLVFSGDSTHIALGFILSIILWFLLILLSVLDLLYIDLIPAVVNALKSRKIHCPACNARIPKNVHYCSNCAAVIQPIIIPEAKTEEKVDEQPVEPPKDAPVPVRADGDYSEVVIEKEN